MTPSPPPAEPAATPRAPFSGRERLLTEHRALLERWRHTMNLVGPGPLDPHYADADAALRDLGLEGRWVDLGTGAGFPGIPMAAMYPSLRVDLVDSRAKRCTFLHEVIERAGTTGITIHQARLETLPADTWDGLTARALAPPDEVLHIADRLLRSGGRCVLFLQGDVDPPTHPSFTLESQRDYRTGGRPRRAAILRRAGKP